MIPVESMQESRGRRYLNRTLFWLTAATILLALYWFCLKVFYPRYFSPLSAFHVDFYDYASVRARPFFLLLTTYPRPVSYLAMKYLASLGFRAMLAGGIAIALINALLTFALARKAFALEWLWSLGLFGLYLLLLFAHPQFYIEHRHDLPAEVSYLFLTISLLAWMSYVQGRKRLQASAQILLFTGAITGAVLFVFAKETFFLSALCLVAGLALANRRDWRTPVDAEAILLSPGETSAMLKKSGFNIEETRFFLYFPESLYRIFGRYESLLCCVPLGGQYAVFAKAK